ncbi:ADP-ribosylation factor-like protein 6-interacting protein 4 [Limulus polyphemus]|uniref:ADP-ribosylation factor-like protein 6-interacting protein 4 n=1 Tax=Limulus polyphemus TaxID=6850 RepID=A0ABM1BQ19_LIMPO|nr:ADP-ribosylation factor-like protein 6-interacting protein 4 [Limulus polyphemus]XP_013786455.1 ADP-ribosylation factor-like protein 6-interacting protein 4 [Limulus polyphemus]XP_022254748.1 ADP-ribosylation factor-like protein 6-interacting protein 4 [Limulus polyphemus]XP_022254749.1 ADP-ribosylation factor-like protein 6-interacting protein 4 [Limulus polyphemus]
MIGPQLSETGNCRMVPMSKEEWEKQQTVVRRVKDPETGRNRLVKGSGEVLEEIVSYERFKEINKKATSGDGAFFQKQLVLMK